MNMKWTRKQPTAPGWYWVRAVRSWREDDPFAAHVFADPDADGALVVTDDGVEYRLDEYADRAGEGAVVEWAGPIPEPRG